MILSDYHMHTTWCDGVNTAEEMIRSAIDKGMEEIGISGHSYTFFDESYCMSEEDAKACLKELSSLREKYAGRIRLRIGVEQDYWSEAETEDYDYVIGSVHYVRIPRKTPVRGVLSFGEHLYLPVDESAEIQRDIADRYFGGDMIAFGEEYFGTVADVCRKTGCDIVGHFDLIAKFNEGGALFDEGDPRYVSAWKQAADRLIEEEALFEINTGAMSKGYRSQPYPADPIREYIRERGGRFILSSDSHRADTIAFAFDRYEGEV